MGSSNRFRSTEARGISPKGRPTAGRSSTAWHIKNREPARSVPELPGEAEPQEGRREAPRQGFEKVSGRAPDLPLLHRPIGCLLPHLPFSLRPGRYAPGCQHLRHRRLLRHYVPADRSDFGPSARGVWMATLPLRRCTQSAIRRLPRIMAAGASSPASGPKGPPVQTLGPF
jgi:hypothetical protein